MRSGAQAEGEADAGGGCGAHAVWGATAVARGDAVHSRVQGALLGDARSASQTKHPHPRSLPALPAANAH